MECYVLSNDETGKYIKGVDSEGVARYTEDLRDAAVVDRFVAMTLWHGHTPATIGEDEMISLFGEVRQPSTFAELSKAEDRVQKKLAKQERPSWWRRLLSLFRKDTRC